MSRTHLFGEMDLDFSKPVDQVYKEAFRIGEACAYVTTYEKRDGKSWLEICGDTSVPDEYLSIFKAYYQADADPKKEKVTSVERVIMKSEGWDEENRHPRWRTIKVIPVQIA